MSECYDCFTWNATGLPLRVQCRAHNASRRPSAAPWSDRGAGTLSDTALVNGSQGFLRGFDYRQLGEGHYEAGDDE